MSRLSRIPPVGKRNRVRRLFWGIARHLLYHPTPVALHSWRCLLLRLFGAVIDAPAYPYPDARIWAPWNLTMASGSCLGPGVECYNVAPVKLGRLVTVSQRSHLCTASHEFDDADFHLNGAPITLEDEVWVAAEAFIGPGVTVGIRAVVLARSVIVRDVPCGAVMGGNPARYIRERNYFLGE